MAKVKKANTGLNRTVVFEVSVANNNIKKQVMASIDKYRAVARKMYSSVAMAATAGATIEVKNGDVRVKPYTQNSKDILSKAYNVSGKAQFYELRNFVLKDHANTWQSVIWDSCRLAVAGTWNHADPEFSKGEKKVGRGWLSLQGARAFGFFNRCGIGLPNTKSIQFGSKSMTMKWDKEIDDVTFFVDSKLPGNTFWKFKNIRDGVWERGTCYIGWKYKNIGGGKKVKTLYITMTYKLPENYFNEESGEGVMIVEFTDDPENGIVMYSDDKFHYSDKISVYEAIAWNKQLNVVKDYYKKQRASVGGRDKQWGLNQSLMVISNKSENLTKRRINGKKHRNHIWANRIVARVRQWGMGVVVLKDFPDGLLIDQEWSMFELKEILKYKLREIGCELKTYNTPKEEEAA